MSTLAHPLSEHRSMTISGQLGNIVNSFEWKCGNGGEAA
jgi:hypothetical protein